MEEKEKLHDFLANIFRVIEVSVPPLCKSLSLLHYNGKFMQITLLDNFLFSCLHCIGKDKTGSRIISLQDDGNGTIGKVNISTKD